eukprot:307119-Chlamydomonas_euryale.AAC.1
MKKRKGVGVERARQVNGAGREGAGDRMERAPPPPSLRGGQGGGVLHAVARQAVRGSGCLTSWISIRYHMESGGQKSSAWRPRSSSVMPFWYRYLPGACGRGAAACRPGGAGLMKPTSGGMGSGASASPSP